ncbi:ABC transporter permease [Pseudomonas sp. B21-036]|jgi:peptide/nickel transport system permease protein|uniref:ABC transporter permease n=1 Tax=Pseudomonas sp. B21-036 TaxID=2895485 RepID=UPI00215DF312|nr:ABC transporter permease [Pseudomonas sp. B21-036]UVL53642.1 ABC transporter permease [Pseudomonas sp. B21-036]
MNAHGHWLKSSVTGAASLAATLLGLLVLTFFIGRALPVDPVLAVVGEHASADVYERTRIEMGLDQPVTVQFARYLGRVLNADLGTSVVSGQPVLRDLASFFPATFELATVAMLIGALVGIPAGVLAAVHRNRWPDVLVRITGLVGYSAPVFWLGIVGLVVFYVTLGWVGGPGRLDTLYQYSIEERTGLVLIDTLLAGSWDGFVNALSHLLLPAVVLAWHTAAYLSRMTRALMIDELNSEYILAARMKGLSDWRVVWRHAFINIRVPLLTSAALAYAYLLEGAVVTETVFAWPGIGMYITQSLFSADLPAVLGATTLIGLLFLMLNRFVDWLYPRLDARIKS